MPYQFLENVATADVAFDASGKTVEELFESCALATMDVMVDINTIEADLEHVITLHNADIDKLLFEFLEELIYLKDSDCFIFSEFQISITDEYSLTAVCKGAILDPETQETKSDVKAVTLHRFEVKKGKNGWTAQVVLDI